MHRADIHHADIHRDALEADHCIECNEANDLEFETLSRRVRRRRATTFLLDLAPTG